MALPLADESVAFVVCAQVYEHVPSDVQLFAEIHRVLRPDGIVFFSGPNWLFPVEPHYFLPFLHWLPRPWADAYLRMTGKGNHFYERSRHIWGLRRVLRRFRIRDVTVEVLQQFHLQGASNPLARCLSRVPAAAWRILVPLFPNFNWLLTKA
jgi:SAM-dependent methyltransferase